MKSGAVTDAAKVVRALRAAHLHDGRRHRVRLAGRFERRQAGQHGGEIAAVEGIAGARRIDG